MDYKGHICPVCDKAFEKGDDVVVCPECGTPHHRVCYEQNGSCFNLKRHPEGYDYKRECEVNAPESDTLKCSFCDADNPQNSRFCNYCGRPLSNEEFPNSASSKGENGSAPQGGFGTVFVMDPLGGVDPQTDIGSGVTAGEAAKLVKNSTPYFIPQFKQLKEKGRTRFSFVGFIFAGGWMLYRKMYKSGAVVMGMLALLVFASTYISVCHATALQSASELYSSMLGKMMSDYSYSLYTAIGDLFSSLTDEQLAVCIASIAINLLTLAIRVICGICGNRWYYKHTLKTVSKIKADNCDGEKFNALCNTKGGVNVPLGVVLILCYYIIIYLPVFL